MVIEADPLEITFSESPTRNLSGSECGTYIVDGRFNDVEGTRQQRIRPLLCVREFCRRTEPESQDQGAQPHQEANAASCSP